MQYLDPQLRLSLHFRVWEFCASDAADAHGVEIRVVEDSPVHRNLRALCHHTLEPVRIRLGPLHISSGYRPAHVNELVGGVADSQHCTGEAADCWHDTVAPIEVAQALLDTGAPFDQLILEHDQGVVHASLVRDGDNRSEVLTRYTDAAGALRYLRGLVAEEELPA